MAFDALGIVSSDIPKTLEFYKTLGLKFVAFSGEGDHYEATTESGIRIMLDSEKLMKKINPNWEKPSGNGVVLCFKKSSSMDVDLCYSDVVEQGFESIKEPWNAFWGQRYCSVKDPSGTQIDIFADLR